MELLTKVLQNIEIETSSHQLFLESEQEILKHHLDEDKAAQNAPSQTRPEPGRGYSGANQSNNSDMESHIGPVQFNMGGIQVDAEQVISKIHVWPELTTPSQFKSANFIHRTAKTSEMPSQTASVLKESLYQVSGHQAMLLKMPD
jgi:hypothetical protein